MQQIYEFDTSNVKPAEIADDLFDGRRKYAAMSDNGMNSEVTVVLQAYNRIEKTKRAVESILRNATDVNYDLLLIDNGSTDGTFEYFKSVNFPKKRIIHITKNISSYYPGLLYDASWFSKYKVSLADDQIATPHWLSNLIKVAESDSRIGLVNPVQSNISGLEQVNLEYSDYEDMQKKAAEYNVSDPAKWHERVRMVINGELISKDCIYAIGYPIADPGFFHDFADDDISFRIRRAGYKVVLAEDTWICHDHPQNSSGYSDMEAHAKSIEIGRQNFRDKYFGIDAWDDVMNFIPEYIQALKQPSGENKPRILGIDVRCGTPILEIKNRLKSFGIFDASCSAFTQQGKYFIDLQTVCGAENVCSGPIEFVGRCFDEHSFDYAVIGEDINTYADPVGIIKSVLSLVKKGGQIFLSLKNTDDVYSLLRMFRKSVEPRKFHSMDYSLDEFAKALWQEGLNLTYIRTRTFNISESDIEYLKETLSKIQPVDDQMMCALTADKHYFYITA